MNYSITLYWNNPVNTNVVGALIEGVTQYALEGSFLRYTKMSEQGKPEHNYINQERLRGFLVQVA